MVLARPGVRWVKEIATSDEPPPKQPAVEFGITQAQPRAMQGGRDHRRLLRPKLQYIDRGRTSGEQGVTNDSVGQRGGAVEGVHPKRPDLGLEARR